MEGGANTEAIRQFRNLITAIKRPLLDGDVNTALDETNIVTQLQTLYRVLKQYIQTGTIDERNPLSKDIIEEFTRNGGFQQLKTDPQSKSLFLYYLNLDVNVYPYTIAPKATNFHASHHIESNK